jgi:hypothetical protein
MNPANVNWAAALVAAVSTFLIGGLWYSPLLFARPWMEANGLVAKDLESGGMARVFGGSFALALVSSINLAFFLADGKPDLMWGLTAGALAGVGWVATSLGVTYLFERKPLKLYLINAGYHALSFTVMGGILGIWK